jgi:hypothetical protein
MVSNKRRTRWPETLEKTKQISDHRGALRVDPYPHRQSRARQIHGSSGAKGCAEPRRIGAHGEGGASR